MPSIDVSIVTWNSAAVLPELLESLQRQTLTPASITVVDNASTDGTTDVVRKFPNIRLLSQTTNRGFAAGHNLGLGQGSAQYVLVVNPDVVLAADYLKKIVAFAERRDKAGAFVGTVRRPDGQVDTTGLKISPWRVVRERTDVPDQPQQVFGVSGAVALYRRKALADVSVDSQIFAENFFAYKEDVQLAWRLQWAGWEAWTVPVAAATHARAVGVGVQRGRRDAQRRFLSYRNHLLLYATVESAGTILPDLWASLPAELGRLLFLVVSDPVLTVRALAGAVKMWHAARTFAARERRVVSANRVRTALHA